MPYFKDECYIKIDGKSVYLMYRSELRLYIVSTIEVWLEEANKAGLEELYLNRLDNFTKWQAC